MPRLFLLAPPHGASEHDSEFGSGSSLRASDALGAALSQGVAPDISDSDEAKGRAASSPEQARALPKLLVLVTSGPDSAVANAEVSVALLGESPMQRAGRTNANGELIVDPLPSARELLYVHVKAQGFSTAHWIRPLLELSLDSDPVTCPVVLRPAATLKVLAKDESNRLIPDQRVIALFLHDNPNGPRDASRFPRGAQMYRVAVTGDTGAVVLDDLEPGYWAVRCDEWREFADSEEVTTLVSSNDPATIEIAVPSLSPATVASGRLSLPEMQSISELHTIDRYRLDATSGATKAFWIYRGGQFFVTGEPDTTYELKVVDQKTERESRPFEIKTGVHGHQIEPVWR